MRAALGHKMPLTDIIVILAGILGLLIRFGGRILTMYQYQRMSIQLESMIALLSVLMDCDQPGHTLQTMVSL